MLLLQEEAEKKVLALKTEVDKLAERVRQAQEKYSKVSTENIAVEAQFKIKQSENKTKVAVLAEL